MILTERTPDGRRIQHDLRANPAAGRLTKEEEVAIQHARKLPPQQTDPKRNKQIDPVRRAAQEKRKQEISAYMPLMLGFLDAQNTKNVIPLREFQEFMPLFKKELLDGMEEDDKAQLSYKYSQRINIQHPVIVIDDDTEDADGAMYKGRKYKIIFTLPSWTNRLETVNKQGPQALRLAAEYIAATKTHTNPFDTRQAQYSSALAGLLHKGNASSVAEQEKQRSSMEKDLAGKLLKPLPKQEQSSETQAQTTSSEPTEPAGLDADWEE